MARRPFKLRELLQKLRPYGIKMLEKAGKGSECILLKPAGPGSRQGPQFPIKNHLQKLPIE